MTTMTAFDVIGEVRESLITESLEWLDATAALVFTPKKESPLLRFMRSGWGVAVICAVVSLSVLGGIIWAGQKDPVSPVTPSDTTQTEVTEEATDAEEQTDTVTEAELQTQDETQVETQAETEAELVTEAMTEAATEAETQAPKPVANRWNGSVATSFGGGKGTAADPYLITSGAQLAYLAKSVNSGNTYAGKYFSLTADLNLLGREFTPIGTYDKPFSGIFDGGGHTVSGLNISTFTKGDYIAVGLFSHVKDGQLSNICLDSPVVTLNLSNVSSYVYVGALCGRYTSTSKAYDGGGIHTCLVQNGQITATKGATLAAGGVVGHVYASNGVDTVIRHVESRVTMNTTQSTLSYTGGVAGVLYCKDGSRVEIKDFCCYATISATRDGGQYVGAIGALDAADGRITLRGGYSDLSFKGEIGVSGSSYNSSYKNDGYAMVGLVCQSHLPNKYYFYDLTGKLTASNQSYSTLYYCAELPTESGVDHQSAYPKRGSLDATVWDLTNIRKPALIFPWAT